MRILMLSHEYPPVGGGGANACMNLSRNFVSRGHEVDIVTVRYGQSVAKENFVRGRMRIYRLPARRKVPDHCSFLEMLDFLFKADRFVCKTQERRNYDVCLCFFGIPAGPAALHLKLAYGLPYIIRFGGGDIPGFQERFQFLYKILGPVLKVIWKNAGALVANSEGLRALANDFCSRYPVAIIHNGVDTDFFSAGFEEKEKKPIDEVSILTVTRLIERKGIQDVIPCIKDAERLSGKRIRWTIAGSGPYLNDLKELAEQCGVRDRIRFVGNKSKEELVEYYHKADFFLLPSHKEGMPNAVLEAMSCGLPIIMYASCQGAKELIERNGVPAYGSILDALVEMLNMSKEERNKMGRRSRELVETRFTWNFCAEQYLLLCEEILRKK